MLSPPPLVKPDGGCQGGSIARPRRTREEWLQAALDALSEFGEARIRLRDLCETLGVTTGSFYAHFEGREDFIRQVVQYWKHRYTDEFNDTMKDAAVEPRRRLIAVAEGVIGQDLGRYDVVVRAWAAHEPSIAPIVRAADKSRFDLLRSIFASAGFEGDDLNMRTRTYVTYYSLERHMLIKMSKKDRLNEIEHRVDMLLAPASVASPH